MIRINVLIGLLMMVFCFSDAIGQEEKLAGQNQQVFVPAEDPLAEMDPKLTAEERDLLLQAGQDNPDKIEQPAVDTKLLPDEIATEKDFGLSNAKPTGPQVDSKMRDFEIEQEVNPVPAATPEKHVADQTQPEGEGTVETLNRRTINGPNTQPEGDAPKNVLDRRTLKGDNVQPEGEQ